MQKLFADEVEGAGFLVRFPDSHPLDRFSLGVCRTAGSSTGQGVWNA